MRRPAMTALLALSLVCVALAAAGHGALEIVLFDAPRGAWLGALRDDAPLVVLEERDGWRRVRLEGWTMAPAAPGPGSALSGGAGGEPAPAAVAASAPRPVAVQGVLAPPLGAGGAAGSGVLVLLVKESGALDSEHLRIGAEQCLELASLVAVRAAMNADDGIVIAEHTGDLAVKVVQRIARRRDAATRGSCGWRRDSESAAISSRSAGRAPRRSSKGPWRGAPFPTPAAGSSSRGWSRDATASWRSRAPEKPRVPGPSRSRSKVTDRACSIRSPTGRPCRRTGVCASIPPRVAG